MNKLDSNLKFQFGEITNTTSDNYPTVVYKYFSNIEDRDNFLRGNIWFAGPNQNRIFTDSFEYRNRQGLFMFEYALSFSTEIIEPEKPNIKINDPKAFVQTIIDSVKADQMHEISWLNKDQVDAYKDKIPSIAKSLECEIRKQDLFLLHVSSVGAHQVEYVDKNDIGSTSMEVARNARDKNDEHIGQKKWRVHINTGDFLNEYSGFCLENLVKHLKLRCASPLIKKCCELI